jgi:hypothetical protein
MPKLIRIQGNSSVNDEEIKNTFREPVIIKPNSKVALIGVSAIMEKDLGNTVFPFTGVKDNKFEVWNSNVSTAGPNNFIATATVEVGIYNVFQLATKVEEACNYCLNSLDLTNRVTGYQGVDYQILYNEKMKIVTHQSAFQQTVFTPQDPEDWTQSPFQDFTGGDVKTGFNASGGHVAVRQQGSVVPRVWSTIKAALTAPDTIYHNIYAAETETSEVLFGVNATGGKYFARISNTSYPISDVSGQILAAAGDIITLTNYGGDIRVYIENSAGAAKGAGSGLPNNTAGYYFFLNKISQQENNTVTHWSIAVDDGGGVSNVQTTSIRNHLSTEGLSLHSLKDNPINAFIQFTFIGDITSVEVNNYTLATYMGFNGIQTQIAYSGTPAILTAPEVPQGVSENPGVLITLDGLGSLDSHDGANESRSQSNILYVLNTPDVLGQSLQLDVAAPFYLDLNNKYPVNVNELRCRFLPFAGGKTALKFQGKPSVAILIAG